MCRSAGVGLLQATDLLVTGVQLLYVVGAESGFKERTLSGFFCLFYNFLELVAL